MGVLVFGWGFHIIRIRTRSQNNQNTKKSKETVSNTIRANYLKLLYFLSVVLVIKRRLCFGKRETSCFQQWC